MDQVLQADLGKLTASEFRRISIGLKPSGLIHLGTAMTFLHGMIGLQKNRDATLDVAVMDLDFDFQRGPDFVSFQAAPDTQACHVLMKEHTEMETVVALNEMASYFGVNPQRIKVGQFSQITYDPRFQEYLDMLFGTLEGRRLLGRTVNGGKYKTSSFLAPICNSCGHSSTHPPKLRQKDTKIVLETKCYNDGCEVEKYSVSLTEPGKVNLFYLVDPIRDLIPNLEGASADVHIFGGDYISPYGIDGTPKANRVFRLMEGLSSNAPLIYVGPVLTYGGSKVGKSLQNVFTVESMRAKHPNWVERLHDLLNDHPTAPVIELKHQKKYFI